MTVEVKAEETQVVEVVVSEQPEEALKVVEETQKVDESKPKIVKKSSSFREESNFLSDLKENEKKALNDLKLKLEAAILGNNLFKKEEQPKETAKSAEKVEEEEAEIVVESVKQDGEEKEELKVEEGKVEGEEEKKQEEGSEEKTVECVNTQENEEEKKADLGVVEEKLLKLIGNLSGGSTPFA
ncbi:Patellin-4 [Camellia lanceoleosa]|uniref:Patellin-4 n=1 Tax=Camellia lanceoleosa TaxID=1840588 RepID=A0ACC0GJ08_9ERIC|nr:Patellin-4 [Camellia lanceoleosa]